MTINFYKVTIFKLINMVSELYETELRTVINLLKTVGEEILFPHYGKATGVQRKSDGTLSCDQDRIASARIREVLKKEFPEYGMVEEESGIDQRAEDGFCWTIDPLDSTRGYINQEGINNLDYASVVGLFQGYQPVMGLMFKPHKQELVWAVQGRGAFREYDHGPEKLQVSDSADLKMVVSVHRRSEALDEVIRRLNIDPSWVMLVGGSTKFVEIAKGTATVGYQPPENTMSIWDIAPIEVIVTEAGGMFTDAQGRTMDYTQTETVHRGGVIATNSRENHDLILRVMPS